MGFLLFWTLMAIVSALLAKRYKRDPVAWGVGGLLIGVFAPLLLLIAGEKKD